MQIKSVTEIYFRAANNACLSENVREVNKLALFILAHDTVITPARSLVRVTHKQNKTAARISDLRTKAAAKVSSTKERLQSDGTKRLA